jgi:hypothetical protein
VTKDIFGWIVAGLGVISVGLYNFIGDTNTEIALEKERSIKEDEKGDERAEKLELLHQNYDKLRDDLTRLECRVKKGDC